MCEPKKETCSSIGCPFENYCAYSNKLIDRRTGCGIYDKIIKISRKVLNSNTQNNIRR